MKPCGGRCVPAVISERHGRHHKYFPQAKRGAAKAMPKKYLSMIVLFKCFERLSRMESVECEGSNLHKDQDGTGNAS
jgi:hypothetical protein